MPDSIEIRPLKSDDYDAANALWRASAGIVIRADETREAFVRFLDRNPGLSLGAFVQGKLVGAVMVGHDGRRGYLYHFAVEPTYRRSGIGRQLVEAILRNLSEAGIDRLHAFVATNNHEAKLFWKSLGWNERPDLAVFSHIGAGQAPNTTRND